MDFNTLREMAKKVGGILVLNGNTPEFVILPYEKYAESISTPVRQEPIPQPQPKIAEEDQALIDALNKEIQALKEEIRQKEAVELGEPKEV